MRIHSRSVVQLHDLYHRKEGERYVVGDPESGEYLFVSPPELRALQLLNAHLEVRYVRQTLAAEGERVDLDYLLHALSHKRLIYRVDERVIAPRREPSVEFHFPAKLFGNPAIKFLLALVCLFGIFTLAWRGVIPGPGAFMYQENITMTMLAGLLVAWLYVFLRQLSKYGQALYLGLPARFGLRNAYHLPIPSAHVPPSTEEQHRRIVHTSLLTLLASVSAAALIASWSTNPFWSFVFLIGILELLAECLLFLDTDLARAIGYGVDVHKLNEQTAEALRNEWKLFWRAQTQEMHPKITSYALLYLLSYVLAIILLVGYIIPIGVDVIGGAFTQFEPSNPGFGDAIIALGLLTVSLFSYAFATLKHHPLAHNTLFINGGLLAITGASFLAATVVTAWVIVGDAFMAAVVLYALGVLLALAFERAVRLAHPFSELHGVFEAFILPVIAACVPISVLFTVPANSNVIYLMAMMLATGMLSALAFRELSRTLGWRHNSFQRA